MTQPSCAPTGPVQWDERLQGSDYTDYVSNPVHHYAITEPTDPPSARQFADAFFNKWGSQPSYHLAAVMAALYHLEGAVRRSGVGNKAALKAAMDSFQGSSFWGKLAVDKFGRTTRTPVILQYDQEAASQIVAPLSAAIGKNVYPMPEIGSTLRNYPCRAG